MVRNNQLLELLSPKDFDVLDKHCKTVRLRRGDVLAEPGEDLASVYFPHSGIASFMVALRDGALIQTSMVGYDGAIGLLQAHDSKTSINRIVVQADGLASIIGRVALQDAADANPAIRKILAAHDQFFFADVQQTAACNAMHPVEARMARWMLRMVDLTGADFTLTHDQLAAMIGVRRSSVSEVALRMKDSGLIGYSRGELHISNVEALEASACECHQSVRGNYMSLLGVPWPRLDKTPL